MKLGRDLIDKDCRPVTAVILGLLDMLQELNDANITTMCHNIAHV
jgi:hypothetical protein